jgi:hypothetical protein
MVDVNMVTVHELTLNYHGAKSLKPHHTRNLQLKNSHNLANLATVIRHPLNGHLSASFLRTSEVDPGLAWTHNSFGGRTFDLSGEFLVFQLLQIQGNILTRGLPIYCG